MKRAHFRDRKTGVLERLEWQLHDSPNGLAVTLVVHQRKAGFLECGQIAPHRPFVDRQFRGQFVHRAAVSEAVQVEQELPLANDFSVAGHSSPLSG